MLKKREVQDSHALYELMVHPEVFPFVRHQANSFEEYLFLTKQTIEAEERGELISRTILDEWGAPIGTISLFDIQDNAGFLGTWIGKPYHGKGYNKIAKDHFFNELFFELNIETIFLKIRQGNIRSMKAAEKLPYTMNANETRKSLLEQFNTAEKQFNLFEISKDLYHLYTMRSAEETTEQHLKEA
ncbi:GNAT family protein [Metabacillus fastidiosus]|uniref:GNAT family N-acetyltransferase n=1 Tax=Metabacillus fastidiosus TaxID=1458 RepID=UPI002E1D5DED|nr:GNAT family protein [Metabacillus fastidiosus]